MLRNLACRSCNLVMNEHSSTQYFRLEFKMSKAAQNNLCTLGDSGKRACSLFCGFHWTVYSHVKAPSFLKSVLNFFSAAHAWVKSECICFEKLMHFPQCLMTLGSLYFSFISYLICCRWHISWSLVHTLLKGEVILKCGLGRSGHEVLNDEFSHEMSTDFQLIASLMNAHSTNVCEVGILLEIGIFWVIKKCNPQKLAHVHSECANIKGNS